MSEVFNEGQALAPVDGGEGKSLKVRNWLAPLLGATGAVLVLTGLWAAGKGDLLRVSVPAMAVLIGLILYRTRPATYVSFTLWTWVLTPLVRRLIDYRFGFVDQNLVLLTPFLTSSLSALSLIAAKTKARTNLGPYWLAIGAIGYGFLTGMIRSIFHAADSVSISEVTYGLFNWLGPLLFGMRLVIEWPSYRAHRAAIRKTFVWATLVAGIYGIVQYFAPPAWDRYWLESLPVGLDLSTFGRPEPTQIRVWSTLNAPGPFADFMLAGLLYTFTVRTWLRVPALGSGFAAFLLSLVRTSWVQMPISAWVALRSMGKKTSVLIFLLAPVCLVTGAIVLFPDSEAVQAVTERISTIGDLHHDFSAQERTSMYLEMAQEVLSRPGGIGLTNHYIFHNTVIDSGWINMLLSLGFAGTMLYLAAVGMLARRLFAGAITSDPMVAVSKGILIGSLPQLVGSEIFTGLNAVIVWTAAGLIGAHLVFTRAHDQITHQEAPLESWSRVAIHA